MEIHSCLEQVIKKNELVQYLYRKTFSFIFSVWGAFLQKDSKLILFSSYGGKQFSDSPKILFEKMKSDARFNNFEFVWAFERPGEFDIQGANIVKIDSPSYFKVALKASIWVTNVNIERGLRFKKEPTVYINTWHGTGPKKGGNSRKGRHDYDFSNVDILCCDGEFLKNVMVHSFNALPVTLLYGGKPREDELFQYSRSDAYKIRTRLGISNEKRIILYMPTFREGKLSEPTPNWNYWHERLGDSYVILVRTHHFDKTHVYSGKGDFIIDATDYKDVNDLYWISDALISDYSSAFFDYGLLGRPMFCYAEDYDQYIMNPGLYFDLEKEFPNGIARTDGELMDKISLMIQDYEIESKKSAEFCSKYVKHDNDVSSKCINAVYEKWQSKVEN